MAVAEKGPKRFAAVCKMAFATFRLSEAEDLSFPSPGKGRRSERRGHLLTHSLCSHEVRYPAVGSEIGVSAAGKERSPKSLLRRCPGNFLVAVLDDAPPQFWQSVEIPSVFFSSLSASRPDEQDQAEFVAEDAQEEEEDVGTPQGLERNSAAFRIRPGTH